MGAVIEGPVVVPASLLLVDALLEACYGLLQSVVSGGETHVLVHRILMARFEVGVLGVRHRLAALLASRVACGGRRWRCSCAPTPRHRSAASPATALARASAPRRRTAASPTAARNTTRAPSHLLMRCRPAPIR